jgi:hypothetical protein
MHWNKPEDGIDFINGECFAIETILRAQAVSCQALAHANEVDDGIGDDDLRMALSGLAEIFDSLRKRLKMIEEVAGKLDRQEMTGGAR